MFLKNFFIWWCNKFFLFLAIELECEIEESIRFGVYENECTQASFMLLSRINKKDFFFVFNKRHNHSPLCVINFRRRRCCRFRRHLLDIFVASFFKNKTIICKNKIATLNFKKTFFFWIRWECKSRLPLRFVFITLSFGGFCCFWHLILTLKAARHALLANQLPLSFPF